MDWLREPQTNDSAITGGQIVIITARWILIIGALMLTLWNPGGTDALWRIQVQTGLLLSYAAVNFFLHTQYIRQGKQLMQVAYLTSAVDLALITFVIAIQESPSSASIYVFYLPAVLAIAVAFPRQMAALYTITVIGLYGIIAVSSASPGIAVEQVQDVVIRMLMIAAVGFTGGLFRHIEAQRMSGEAKVFAFSDRPRSARPRPEGASEDEGGM